jgi:hypothetical protein
LKPGYAVYATTSTKDAGLLGFGGIKDDDDEAALRGGNKMGRGGGNTGARKPQNQSKKLTMNDEEFPSL